MSSIHLYPLSELGIASYFVLFADILQTSCVRQIIPDSPLLYFGAIYPIPLLWEKAFCTLRLVLVDPSLNALVMYSRLAACFTYAHFSGQTSSHQFYFFFCT